MGCGGIDRTNAERGLRTQVLHVRSVLPQLNRRSEPARLLFVQQMFEPAHPFQQPAPANPPPPLDGRAASSTGGHQLSSNGFLDCLDEAARAFPRIGRSFACAIRVHAFRIGLLSARTRIRTFCHRGLRSHSVGDVETPVKHLKRVACTLFANTSRQAEQCARRRIFLSKSTFWACDRMPHAFISS